MLGLSLRVSWICLLLFSTAACFPATKGDYRYPYTISSADSGSHSPSSVGAPIVAAGSSPSYEPLSAPADMGSDVAAHSPAHEASAFVTFSDHAGHAATTFDSPAPESHAAAGSPGTWFSSGSADSAGHTAMTFPMDGPAAYGAAGPAAYAGLPLQSQPDGGSGNSNLGSGVLAYRPAHGASHSSGSAHSAGHSAPTFPMGGPVPYAAPVGFTYGIPGLPWAAQPAGGADSSFSDPSNWMPSRPFPDFSAWDSNSAMPQGGMMQGASETSPLPPSSYIIQSSNGYQRAREVESHTKYSPEYPEPPVMAFRAAEAPRKSPMTGSKGGPKV